MYFMGVQMGKPTVVSLFTGIMGLDLGFEDTGFEIKVAVEIDRYAISTIRANRPSTPIIEEGLGNADKVNTLSILEKAGLSPGEPTVVTGASPCEPFSTIGKRLSLEDKRASLIDEFLKVVNEASPRYWVFENVPGLKWAARRHVSFYDRTARPKKEVCEDEQPGSAFDDILAKFKATGYYVSEPTILDAADYGTPQHRRRLIIIGAREGGVVAMPSPTHGNPQSPEVVQGERKPWVMVGDVLREFDDPYPEHAKFPAWGEYLKYVPTGGCWRDLPDNLKEEAIGKAFYSSGGRTGFLRKLSWDRPAPTLVDSPITRAACLCHPTESRPLTVGEYLQLQGFLLDWKVEGRLASKYRLIGQATPPPLARSVAQAIIEHYWATLSVTSDTTRECIPTGLTTG